MWTVTDAEVTGPIDHDITYNDRSTDESLTKFYVASEVRKIQNVNPLLSWDKTDRARKGLSHQVSQAKDSLMEMVLELGPFFG